RLGLRPASYLRPIAGQRRLRSRVTMPATTASTPPASTSQGHAVAATWVALAPLRPPTWRARDAMAADGSKADDQVATTMPMPASTIRPPTITRLTRRVAGNATTPARTTRPSALDEPATSCPVTVARTSRPVDVATAKRTHGRPTATRTSPDATRQPRPAAVS